MAGIYGDQLAFFTELMESHEVFTMQPLSVGGFTPRKKYADVYAYFTRNIGGDAGVPDETFTPYDKASFFVFDELPAGLIKQGLYLEVEGTLYKFIHDDTYVKEAGFVAHRLELVPGPTDQQVENEGVNERIASDY